MREQRISIEIDHDGHIAAQAEGFTGETCLRDLEKVLGGHAEWETVERTADATEPGVLRNRNTDLGTRRKP